MKITCTTHKQLIKLYSEKMFCGTNISKPYTDSGMGETPINCFGCENKEKCEVPRLNKICTLITPIYTGTLGDCDSDVMVVGEAPSSVNLEGCNEPYPDIDCTCKGGKEYLAVLGGYTANIKSSGKSPLRTFIDFIAENCGSGKLPYFTDAIKCGVNKQKNRELLRSRKQICPEHILTYEIDIIKPRIIACAGNEAYRIVRDLQNRGLIGSTIKICRFIHYSARQSIKEKQKEWKKTGKECC